MKYVPSLHTRIVACLLLVCLLLSLCACDEQVATPPVVGDVPPPPPSSSVEQVPQQPDPNLFVPTEAYVIVYPSELAEDPVMQEAIAYLNVVMQSAYGFTLSAKDDDQTPHSHEILLGLTSREQSSKLLKDFAVEDFAYSIQAKNVIVMGGKSSSATLQAVKQFCLDVIGYTGNGDIFSKPPTMKLGTVYTNRKYESISINGAPLSSWSIGVTEATRAYAEQIVEYFAYYTNEKIPVVSPEELTGRETNMIVLGAMGKSMSTPYFRGKYYVSKRDVEGSVISMLGTDNYTLNSLIRMFFQEVTETIEGKHVYLTIPEREEIRFLQEDYPTVPTWYLDSETQTKLYDGVTHIEQLFYDENNKPYRTNVLILDPTKVNFYLGNNGVNKNNTTLQHMQTAVSEGKDIIAAVNGGFFNWEGGKGLMIKDGVVLGGVFSSLPVFAVTMDGEIVMDEGDRATYDAYLNAGVQFKMAVSGSGFYLKDGLLPERTYEPEQGPHPRTLVGRTSDGMLIIGVVDGRQAGYSNGVGNARAGLWMRSLGAVDVINLDGGGSSTFILRDPDTNTYDVCNSPSDGSLRKIRNSILVELKPSAK